MLRAPYRLLLIAAAAGPALMFAAGAWWGWGQVQDDAAGDASRNAAILAEHAEGLFREDVLLFDRIDDRIAGKSWDELSRNEAELHQTLASLATSVEGGAAAFLVDADGKTRAMSGRFPVPADEVSVAGRPFFQAARDQAGLVIGAPFKSPVSGRGVFIVARRLAYPDGSFRGVVGLVIDPESVAKFWQSFTASGDSVDLLTSDGIVLARYPTAALVQNGAPVRARDTVAERFRTSSTGLISETSQIDGVTRLGAYRKLRDFPVFVVYAIDRNNILEEWYPILGAFGGITATAALALLAAAGVVLRRFYGEAAALAQLRESEASLRALFRKAPAAMHSLDADHRIIDVSDHWLEQFGCTREEVLGRPIGDFYVGGHDATHEARWMELLSRGFTRNHARQCIRKSGEVFDSLISAIVERRPDGSFIRTIATVVDVTARRRAEETAFRERRFSELIIGNSGEGIIAKDTDLRYTVWNPAMVAITGVPAAEVIGRRTEEVFPSFDGTDVETAWADALAGKATTLHDRQYTVASTGREGYFDQTTSALRDTDGTIGVIAFVRNTTERHRMEETLRQALKMEAVGQLTGGVAHDFNNLLTVISGNLDLLFPQVGGEPQRRLVAAAQRAVERGARLTQSLLAFSRRQALRPEIVNANLLIKEFGDLLRQAAGDTVEVQLLLSPTLYPCRIDPAQFQTTLLNLVTNARDAMPRSGGRISIETTNVSVGRHDDAELKPGDYIVVTVADNGSGMPQQVIARAFEPFYTTKDVGRGSGLGLSQVYGFTKQSGGQARITSEPGVGTSVRMFLPRTFHGAPETVEDTLDTAPEPRAQQEKTILVVDDDVEVRMTIAESLSELGYSVLTAEDGPAALALLERGEPVDLLLADYAMPNRMLGDRAGAARDPAAPRHQGGADLRLCQRLAERGRARLPVAAQALPPRRARPRDQRRAGAVGIAVAVPVRVPPTLPTRTPRTMIVCPFRERTRAMRIEPSGGILGARIWDCDLRRPLDDAAVRAIRDALGAYAVLCFPQQALSPAELAAFGGRFGELEINVASTNFQVPDHPPVMILSNVVEDGRPIGLADAGQGWHTDMSYSRQIALATVLHAKRVPVRDGRALGNTEFRDMRAAYDDLDPAVQARIEGKTAIHDFAKFWDMMRLRPGSRRAALTAAQQARKPPVAQPLVRRHPISGRRVLYCNPGYAMQVEGMGRAESDALLDLLFRHQQQDRYLWAHRWTEGDVLMWDDIATTHNAVADYAPDEPRLMYRVQVMA